jgi:hypothetical protein
MFEYDDGIWYGESTDSTAVVHQFEGNGFISGTITNSLNDIVYDVVT